MPKYTQFFPILFISIFLKKLNLCLYFLQMPLVRYWFCVVFVAVGFVAWKSLRRQSSPNASGTITRKVFHLLALAIYIPGVIYEPNITHLASSVAVAAFLFIEVSEGGCWFVVPSLITFSLTYPRLRTCFVHVESKRTGLRQITVTKRVKIFQYLHGGKSIFSHSRDTLL